MCHKTNTDANRCFDDFSSFDHLCLKSSATNIENVVVEILIAHRLSRIAMNNRFKFETANSENLSRLINDFKLQIEITIE